MRRLMLKNNVDLDVVIWPVDVTSYQKCQQLQLVEAVKVFKNSLIPDCVIYLKNHTPLSHNSVKTRQSTGTSHIFLDSVSQFLRVSMQINAHTSAQKSKNLQNLYENPQI